MSSSGAQNAANSDVNNNQPGLIASHAQYVKGAAEELVGNVTGSKEWQNSAREDKNDGVAGMKAASEGRDPSKQGFGRTEEIMGKATGCEGMVKEGQESKE